jgi:putative PIN family toxin of toxin-antitoxin system
MPPIVVYDTNTLFSATGWRGKPFLAVELARNGVVEGLTCAEIILELDEKLRLKTSLSADEVDLTIADLSSFLHVIELPGLLHPVPDDPDDDVIIECAVVGHASHIVTGDRKHLLPIKNYQGIVICNAAELLELIKQ